MDQIQFTIKSQKISKSSPAIMIAAYLHAFTKLTSIVLETLFITSHRNHVSFATPIALNVSVSLLAKNALQIKPWKTVPADPVAQTSFTTPRHFFAMISQISVLEISTSAFLYLPVSNA
jgi:hypothetical protein